MTDSNYAPPTAEDIFRYRYQHGTNLGSMFVHGPWLSDGASSSDSGSSKELEEVKRSARIGRHPFFAGFVADTISRIQVAQGLRTRGNPLEMGSTLADFPDRL